MGETLGGLLNATLGNAVELIVAILALIKVRTSWKTRETLMSLSVNSPSFNLLLLGPSYQICFSFLECKNERHPVGRRLTLRQVFLRGWNPLRRADDQDHCRSTELVPPADRRHRRPHPVRIPLFHHHIIQRRRD